VCDYGNSDSDSEIDEDQPVVTKRVKEPEAPTEEDKNEETPIKESESVETPVSSDTHNAPPPPNSKWAGVRQEYEDSALMFKFVSEEDGNENLQKSDQETAVVDNPPQTKVDEDSIQPMHISDPTKTKEMENYFKTSYEASLEQINTKKRDEQLALEREVQAIQNDIASERRTWEALYSDEEEEGAGGAETKAVMKDVKRRQGNVKKVVEEVTGRKVGEDGELEPNLHNKGERWKRLQMMHETKMKNNQEHYGSFPNHMFPLRD